MLRPKHIIALFIYLSCFYTAHALDVQYGTVLSSNKSSILVQYANIGNKINYICNVVNLSCEKTKKFTLSGEKISIIKSDLKK